MYIYNGRKCGDVFGDYTSYQPGGKSVVDYGIASENIFRQIIYFRISQPFHISDHAYLSFKINLMKDIYQEPKVRTSPLPVSFNWNDANKLAYKQYLNHPSTKSQLYHIKNKVNNEHYNGIDEICENISNLLLKAASKTLKKKRHTKSKRIWHDGNIIKLKRNILALGAKLKKERNHFLEEQFHAQKRLYNSMVKRENKKAKNMILQKIQNLEVMDNKKILGTH